MLVYELYFLIIHTCICVTVALDLYTVWLLPLLRWRKKLNKYTERKTDTHRVNRQVVYGIVSLGYKCYLYMVVTRRGRIGKWQFITIWRRATLSGFTLWGVHLPRRTVKNLVVVFEWCMKINNCWNATSFTGNAPLWGEGVYRWYTHIHLYMFEIRIS